MLRLGISEPFTPPLVLWITPALDSMPLTANERKARKNSNVLLKAPSVALGSLPVPLLLYPNESHHGENSHCLLLSGEVFSVPRSDIRSCLREILKYGSVIPTLKPPNACGRTSLFFMSSVEAVTLQEASVSLFENRMMPRMSSWVDFFHSGWSVKLTLFLNAMNYMLPWCSRVGFNSR